MENTEERHPAQDIVPDFDKWACNANECMTLEIRSPFMTTSFQPTFTYPLFGSHETIFGYKDLAIEIKYTNGSLRAFVDITYSAKYQPSSSSSFSSGSPIEADDIAGPLKKYMSQDTTTNIDAFDKSVKEDAATFRPLGEKVYEYQVEADAENEDEDYEIYKCSFKDPRFREYHRRMQFFVLLFIEGSSYIDDEDEKWEIYTLYKRQKKGDESIYTFVGYCTAYPFYCWLEQTRMRISQFLILPTYQGKGHGGQLYRTIYELFAQRKDVLEITVEDPNEEFSDLRDKSDLRYLRDHGAFDGITIPVPQETIQQLQKKYKLTNRQIQTSLEIYLLSNLNKRDREAYKNYRLQVKQRLYRFNYDTLQEIEPEDRKDKLHETYMGVEQDYHRLLEEV
ncbi:acyl-CoA N-acyltransferase [Halteromyces radiatus]|uniref:acyl-CoA N-acyltransferase n=1 Tax=Halteromyces radiatus TaxID=101107 RepID=UPI002220A2C0|nr:acyl-CoA N-acyltransferase [Halteromyces radiatus]KAI8081698.1 acyl-CoA N-acyltransferase [Halteromyces radiatus]